jgi:hypothetical protein
LLVFAPSGYTAVLEGSSILLSDLLMLMLAWGTYTSNPEATKTLAQGWRLLSSDFVLKTVAKPSLRPQSIVALPGVFKSYYNPEKFEVAGSLDLDCGHSPALKQHREGSRFAVQGRLEVVILEIVGRGE